MNLALKLVSAACALATCLAAQTTGVVGVNDLDIRLPPTFAPLGNGTTSCTFVGVASGTTPYSIFYDYIAPGATATTLALGMGGCTPALFPFLPAAGLACAGPLAGSPLTNIWFSINISGPWPIFVPGNLASNGSTRWNFSLPSNPSQPIWAQAIALDLCSPTGFKFSQALGFQ